jgi:hypothetical protein
MAHWSKSILFFLEPSFAGIKAGEENNHQQLRNITNLCTITTLTCFEAFRSSGGIKFGHEAEVCTEISAENAVNNDFSD